MKAAVAVAAALVLACSLAGTAHADGDPASDFLLATKLFLPFDVKVPKERQRELLAFVEAANRSGYAIRVAVIGSSYDMGSVTSLWRRPRTYARFLGAELQFVYAKRLLIVMPNGFGVSWKGHTVDREYAVLSKVPIGKGASGLVDAAQVAVSKLAAAAGVKVKEPTPAAVPHGGGHSRVLVVLAAVAALALAVLARLALRRPR
jgi:hypothetical protein